MAEPRKYAEGTEVSAEKSRAELETLLRRHGANEFAVYTGPDRTVFTYRLQGYMVRHTVDYPPAPVNRVHYKALKPDVVHKIREAEWRRRWRALLLVVKAKLELISSGGSTAEREFMADMLLANGETMADAMLPRLRAMYESGEMPNLLLGPGAP